MKIPAQVLAFAGSENIDVYKKFVDYWNHYRALNGAEGVEYEEYVEDEKGRRKISFAEKEEQMTSAMLREVLRVSKVDDMAGFPPETWASHPSIKWAMFAVVSAMIDMILPETVIANTNAYADVRVIGWGDNASFDVEPRDLFIVSKGSRNKRTTELKKQFKGQVVVFPEPREMTVFVSLPKVLAGKESLAEFVTKMTLSFETQLATDIYDAFATAMGNLSNTANTGLRVAGYTQSEFVRLAQTVGAWNNGAKPIAVGTHLALANILPSNANYRYDIESDFVRVGYIRNFHGVDIMELPQVADWTNPFALKLANDKIWLISPASQKIIKVVLEGNTLAYTSDMYATANLTQTSTIFKSWGMAVATNAVAAQISL